MLGLYTLDFVAILFQRNETEHLTNSHGAVNHMHGYGSMRQIVKYEEKLVEAVKSYPCLRQVTSRAYKDIIAKSNAWKRCLLS